MRLRLSFAVLIALAAPALGGLPVVRIKDIARVQGDRHNQLVGYGLVVGLEGTGDSAQVTFTNQAVRNLVTRFGNRPEVGAQIKTKNVAAAVLTADLPPFAKPGDRIDVVVSSLGDARSLQGGILLQAPLQGADGNVYAVAQGPVSLGGFAAAGAGAQITKNHPTVGRVPGGALVESAPPGDAARVVARSAKPTAMAVPRPEGRDGGPVGLATEGLGSLGIGNPETPVLSLSLAQPDSATAVRIARAINQAVAGACAGASDSGTVTVPIPDTYLGRQTEFLALIGDLTVSVDAPARVVINERTGTIVVGGPVTISPIAIAHGSLTVEVATTAAVSQPPPLSPGQTVVAPQTEITAAEQTAALAPVQAATVDDLVRALNALHATPRDLIAILQGIKQAGALNAELEVM